MKPRVLNVDDDAGIREFVRRVLHAGGYDVADAANGTDALRVLDEPQRFDGCVLDLMMPGMRGDDLAREVRRRDLNAKVLYFTGFSDDLFKHKTALWQGEAFLDKPVTADALLQALSLLLYGHTRGPEA